MSRAASVFMVQEFELSLEGESARADPFGPGEPVVAPTLEEAARGAAERLHGEAAGLLAAGRTPPEPDLGHAARRGGRVVVVGARATLADVDAVLASDAARALGVSKTYVARLVGAGILLGWHRGRNLYVSRGSLGGYASQNKPCRLRAVEGLPSA